MIDPEYFSACNVYVTLKYNTISFATRITNYKHYDIQTMKINCNIKYEKLKYWNTKLYVDEIVMWHQSGRPCTKITKTLSCL